MKYFCINGEFTKSTEISCLDRGFRFGDGVFETLSVANNKLYLLEYHIERLETGLKCLEITADTNLISNNLLKLIKINGHKEGIARIIVSRGIGSKGYLPLEDITPTTVIETDAMRKTPNHPVRLCISSFEKPPPKSIPTSVKLLQGLNSTLAKMEAHKRGFFEGILLSQQGEVCEVSSGNIFWIKDEQIYTPSIDCGLVSGVMRRRIIEKSPLIIIQGRFTCEALLTADEVFITNTSWPLLLVEEIDNKKFTKFKLSLMIHNTLCQDKKLHCS